MYFSQGVWSWPQDQDQVRQAQKLAIFDPKITFCWLIFILGSCLTFNIGYELFPSPLAFLCRWTSILGFKIPLIIKTYMLIYHNWYFLFCFHIFLSLEFRGLEGSIHAKKREAYEVPRAKLNNLYNLLELYFNFIVYRVLILFPNISIFLSK